jgi:GDP-6-deoxy-D-talose 4-dehydrogenase
MKILEEMKQQTRQGLQRESVFKKVLITGIDGFTGKYLEKFLISKGYDVYGTVFIDNILNKKHFQCDIRNKTEINSVIKMVSPDFILHFAAISFVEEKNKSLMYDVNVFGTQNLLECIVENNLNPEKIIVVSSAAVYGNQSTNILSEELFPNPINHYGYSKYVAERITSTFFSKLKIITVRPFNYTGIKQSKKFLIPKIVSHFAENLSSINLGNINVSREFNYISDIANSYLELLNCHSDSILVNICSKKSTNINYIINYLNSLAGYKINVKIDNDLIRNNEINDLKGSNVLLKSLIDYRFKYSIEQTLSEMFNNYKNLKN